MPVNLVGVSYSHLDVASTALGLRDGDTVVVALFADGMTDVATAAAIVRGAAERPGGARYALQVVDPDRLSQTLPSKAQAAFNRRAAFRVVPDSREPVIAVVSRLEGSPFPATPVISVSVSGFGVLMRGRDSALGPGDRVTASFEVPGQGLVELVGSVRYGVPLPAGTRVGLMIDPQATPNFPRQQKRLAQYVMALQRRMLRAPE